MIQIDFLYESQTTSIQSIKSAKMKDIIQKFEFKAQLENKSIIYLYNGAIIDEEKKVEELIGNNNLNIIKIVANSNSKDEFNTNKSKFIKTKYIKCPECHENIRIKVNDFKIKLFDCKNKHIINDIFLDEFENTQKVDISKIVCQICNESKSNTFNNQFYICCTCKMNLCPLCKSNHDTNHDIINDEQKDYICEIHNEKYIKYCNDCKTNICLLCANDHMDHDIILYESIIPNINKLKNEIIKLKNSIDILKSDINIIINKLNKVMENIDIYYNICNNILKNYEIKNRNYEILQNVNEIDDTIINEINKIIKENNSIKKMESILNIYKRMKNNEIELIYNIKDEDKKKVK